eukprot:767855-Hanusia_phi.AAC.3
MKPLPNDVSFVLEVVSEEGPAQLAAVNKDTPVLKEEPKLVAKTTKEVPHGPSTGLKQSKQHAHKDMPMKSFQAARYEPRGPATCA